MSQSVSETLKQISTLGQLFSQRVQLTPEAEAYRQFESASKSWVSYSWKKIGERVAHWARALDAMGLEHGARIAVLLPNGVDAVCIDQACLSRGFVPVPMHSIDTPGSIGYILNDCQASMLMLSTRAQWVPISLACEQYPHLKLVVTIEDGPGEAGAVPVSSLEQWLAPHGGAPALALADTQAGDLAAIVYTSGTTGKPKGVMLTHENIVANIKAVSARVETRPDDVFLSFLPLSHTFERTIGYYLPVAAGSCVVYARAPTLIAEDLLTARPTVLVSVPRIYERFYAKLQEKLGQASGFKQGLFKLTQQVGWRRFCRKNGLPDGAQGSAAIDALLWAVLEPLVARNILNLFGGRLRAAVSGGAALSQAVGQCFLGLGLPLLQGYGMTETAPVVSANALDDNWPATVGRALEGVQVRIGENNELQVKAPSVMKGYWGRPDDTRAVTTIDGWLRTGDQAVIEDGRIRISGRLKEIMVTSTGEKIPPADLELAIMADPLFEQAMVVGENRPFVSVFAVLGKDGWRELAAKLKLDAGDLSNLHAPAVREALLARVKEASKAFPYYAVPRTVWATLEPWTVENGMITPTLKLKRNALHARLASEIEATYKKN
ncbi:MAG: long-chain fatty acid--CoA ligase [Burkholderiaceae bacterium]|nr:long-chain fatty acid--CoA ligase [Burkholderiaceae bacterium]